MALSRKQQRQFRDVLRIKVATLERAKAELVRASKGEVSQEVAARLGLLRGQHSAFQEVLEVLEGEVPILPPEE